MIERRDPGELGDLAPVEPAQFGQFGQQRGALELPRFSRRCWA
jgi:hypothetical protein